jgi:hypothetical protein
VPKGLFSYVPLSLLKDRGSFGEGRKAYEERFATVIVFISVEGVYSDCVQDTGGEDVQGSIERLSGGNDPSEFCVIKGGLHDRCSDLGRSHIDVDKRRFIYANGP